MTGAYLRVKRNGEWENVEIEYLTDKERHEIFKNKNDCIMWINMLCKQIVDNEKLLDELAENGLIEKAT